MELRSSLDGGTTGRGVISPIAHPSLIELASRANLDFYLLDGELGAISPSSSETAILAARSVGMPLLVRVPCNETAIIGHYLNLGASGIVVPHVSSALSAKKAVSSARYYPDGDRGIGPCRANDYAIETSLLEYTRTANKKTFVMVQIEDAQGVNNCDEIASVPGVDAILVGPNDLALDMDCLGSRDKSKLDEAIDHIIATARTRGVPVCLPVTGHIDGVAAADRGAQLILTSLLSLIYRGMSFFVKPEEQ